MDGYEPQHSNDRKISVKFSYVQITGLSQQLIKKYLGMIANPFIIPI